MQTRDLRRRNRLSGLLIRYREAAGLTQEELAHRSALSVRAISDLERGRTRKPHLRSIELLAKALELDGADVRLLIDTARPHSRSPHLTAGTADAPYRHRDAVSGWVVPRQLPAAARNFVGREAELRILSGLLDEATGAANTAVISAIGGTAGVGKTALALHWARMAAGRFEDGQLYVNLRGFDPSSSPVTPEAAIREFLVALGVPPERIPAAADAQAGLYRSLLADRTMLLVLDNARDERQVRPLLPASPASLVLVTSRSQLTGLAAANGARLLSLDVLAPNEAVQLLTARLGTSRADTEPAAVSEIATLCAYLPLALTVAAARAAGRPGFPLAALAAELRDAAGRLDALDVGDPAVSVRVVFSWSYQQLSQEAAQMFRLLGLHPGPDVTVRAADSLAGTDLAEARRLLGELTRDCLITEHVPGRFAFHDLLRAYAAEQAAACDSEQARRAAVHRMLDHYLHTAHAAALLLKPDREPLTLPPPQPGVTMESITGGTDALAWFQAEYPLLLAAVTLAADTRYDAHAWQIAWALGPFLYRQGYWQEWNTALASALTAAERLGDLTGQAQTWHYLGHAAAMLGLHQDAHGHLHKALDLFGQLGDRTNQAHVHLHFGLILGRQDRYGDALIHDRQGLDLFRAIGHRAGEAAALNSVGWCLAHLGDCQQAVTWCQEALDLYREISDPQSEADTWDSLGYAHHHLGHHAEAVDCYQRALGLYGQAGSRYYRSETLTQLGDTYQAAGNLHAARDAWRQAVAILDDLHHPGAEQVNARLSEHGTPTSSPRRSACRE